ncbi:hypothetical protein Sjap_004381 [Stephania japonica]|uniref:Uncharacterized protein n=1 Tax=Stephania japonica TaxID=461633 RepID=A0AAP0K265_9MAGN
MPTALNLFLQKFLTVLIFSLLSCLTGLLLAGLKVQDPDNSSQTVYDSWIGSGSTPTISFSSTVFPAILCAYAGQAAYLTKFPGIKTLEKQVQLCELSRALAVLILMTSLGWIGLYGAITGISRRRGEEKNVYCSPALHLVRLLINFSYKLNANEFAFICCKRET